MTYDKKYFWVPQYEQQPTTNQHGSRYRRAGDKRVSKVEISCALTDTRDMARLIYLSDTLDVRIACDFHSKPQRASIELLSAEAVNGVM
ncbi:hypothetical protein KAR91_25935 [Candidatus Pacearchaeota archaeon]|nr:hypothetical protein [Candidatus Pacearchaeota archaeon]